MNSDHRTMPFDAASDALVESAEGRFSLALTAHLQAAADNLPHDITERLRFSRQKALGFAAQRRREVHAIAAAPVLLGAGSHGATLGKSPSWWWRMASVLPLALLVGGLVLIQQHHDTEQINSAAEIDSALLADELPPDAYSDAGFGEFLRRPDAP